MWKSVVGHNVSMKVAAEGDDWETDPDFENDVSEQEQRWGAKTIEGSGRQEAISVAELRQKVAVEHEQVKSKENIPKASYGYGGKFGVEKDRMDKLAMGHDYVAQVEQHSSQKDAARGFGGKFGVQKDRVDKAAMGYEYKGEVQQHASQKDYSKGFGGKFGVEKEKVDKAALGYDYKAETEKHQSQKDYSAGFGGRYGVQADRMDKSAAGFSDIESPSSAYEKTQPIEASSSGAGKLKARFENMAKASDEENRKRAEEERARRQAREKREREEAGRQQQEQSRREEETRPLPPVPDEPEDDAPPEAHYYDAVETEPPAAPEPEPQPQPEPEPEPEEEPDYDEPPPPLPSRMDNFLEAEAPQLPYRSSQVDEEEEDDDGTYEDLAGPNLPPPAAEDDYEDLSGNLKAKAIYDYQGEADDEISFNPDDVITNVEMIDEGWWKGQCHGRVGLFPAAYVELM